MLKELYLRDPVLVFAGWIHVFLFLVALMLFFMDGREILGINAWIKPMKFTLSIAVYAWTMAILLSFLAISDTVQRVISWTISLTMFIEILCIFIQSIRGVPSHFNFDTGFDGAVFGAMGVMIGINTFVIVVVLFLFFTHAKALPALVMWGIRIGILGFLLGSAVGSNMVGHMAHTVGAPDGGPGLPFVNWSTIAGDLRIAHFLGLHTLQLFPLVAWGLSSLNPVSEKMKVGLFSVFVIVYGCTTISIYAQAYSGKPLIAI